LCRQHSDGKSTCPVHNYIPDWLKLIEQGDLFQAVEWSHQTNSLLDAFDAVFLGMGTYGFKRGGYPGEDFAGVHEALPYLIANIYRELKTSPPPLPHIDLAGNRVKVFAGGDMVRGSDLVVTAVFEGREAAASIASYLGV